MKRVKAFDLVGKNAISMQSGMKLHNAIADDLLKGEMVEIDFSDVVLFASPFFNASVGVLLKNISIDQLMDRMRIVDCNEVGVELLNTVIQNALSYYNGEKQISDALDKHGKE